MTSIQNDPIHLKKRVSMLTKKFDMRGIGVFTPKQRRQSLPIPKGLELC